jgi:hypothetical protein
MTSLGKVFAPPQRIVRYNGITARSDEMSKIRANFLSREIG